MACHNGTKAKKTALRRPGSEVSCSKSRAETRLILPPSKLRLLPISTKQATSADLSYSTADTFFESAPTPVSALMESGKTSKLQARLKRSRFFIGLVIEGL